MLALLILFLLSTSLFSDQTLSSLLIASAVTDLRREPTKADPNSLAHDPLQESQLLYGEKVYVLEQKGEWTKVEALEQLEWTHHEKWEGYPGWVLSSHLSPLPATGWEPNAVITAPIAQVREESDIDSPVILKLFIGTKVPLQKGTRYLLEDKTPMVPGTFFTLGGEGDQWRPILLVDGRAGWVRKDQIASLDSLRQLPLSQLRQQIITTARTFLGKPYFWGGLSQTVDCSGLVHLSYRANGIDLPRDAHEQFMKSQPIDHSQLEPADLIFFGSEENPERISHVMLYAGDGKIIEGPGTGKFVHEISLEEKIAQNQHRKVYFGSYLH